MFRIFLHDVQIMKCSLNFPALSGQYFTLEFSFKYLDNILVASSTYDEHEKHLSTIFRRLSVTGIAINPAKCVFGQSTVDFLVFQVTPQGLQLLPGKIAALQEFPQPTTVRGLQRFLGMVNFYHRFIKNAATIQIPLLMVISGHGLKSNAEIRWTPDMSKAFSQLKPILAELCCPLFLYPDASDVAIGAVLQQLIKGHLEPLGFFSRKLSLAQTCYSAYDCELYTICAAIPHCRQILEGQQFSIHIDHHSKRDIWYLISEFSTNIRHISAEQNLIADTFSRIDEINFPMGIDYNKLAPEQEDEDLHTSLSNPTLELWQITQPGLEHHIYCKFPSTSALKALHPGQYEM